MEQVQQAQSAQVQEPIQQNIEQVGVQATEPQGAGQQKGTLTAEDFANMPDEEKLKVIQQIEAAQNGVQSEEQEAQQPDNLYSLDEFNAIDLSQEPVDPSRLPQVERDIHAKYMDYFNSQILPQLQELQRIKAAQQPQVQQQQQPTFNDVVMIRAMQALGVNEPNMQDPRMVAEISKQSTLLAQELQQMQYQEAQQQQYVQNTQNIFAQIKKEFKDYDNLNMWGKKELENLPVKTANQIMSDLRSGDYGKVKAVFDFFEKRYVQQHGGQSAINTEDTPPSVLGGSMQGAPAKDFSYDGFASGSEDEQKQMLINAGLID